MSERPRRTQAERTAATRARLIDAAYDCLLETGYAATTVGAVQERAGVARGTLLHHFPTRASLMVGVVEDIADRRLAVLASPDAPPTGQGWDAVVDLLWRDLQSPAFLAALELWVAARTDEPLREALVPLQERLFAAIHRAVTALVGDDPRAPTLVQFTIDLLTGTTMAGMLGPGRARTAVVVERWKDALVTLAGERR
ncbi:TetR/AcrR family transcriptional regulator [Nocardioides sp. W7]|uniref:TetR/AcrR family transcriptional regulator n=1 Tax=Nocardioides sp. W7 TaxID=2931390 RepID=UPI001FD5C545|nr:TetR/AcrR family transcriptional regulator [Nocardioides sp. W7]